MLLSKIALHNYSAFEGTQTLDLKVNGDQKNIILIGAMNGSGKTSLLDAVKLCLYGERNCGLLPPRELPSEFVLKRFNYNAHERHETEMWIELVFDDVELPGATHQIQVRRTWRFHSIRGQYTDDDFTIIKDGKPLQLIDQDHWQDFINDTIPVGIAGFFFFDGEKIQQLADDTNDRETLRESIRNLLGLSVYTKLTGDIDKHTDDIRREADKVTDDQLKQLEADEARVQRLMRENRDQREEIEYELSKLQRDDDQLEQEVRRVARVGADSHSDLQREIGELEIQKRNINDAIMKVAGEFLPFAVAGKLTDELRAQLEAEEKLRQWDASRTRVHPQLERIVQRVFFDMTVARPKPDITPMQRTFYAKLLTDEWEALFIPKPDDAADESLHELSPKDERLILNTLDQVSTQTLGNLRELLKQRERIAKRLQEVSREFRNLPEDTSHIGGMFDQRRKNEDQKQTFNRELGRLDDEYARLERELKSIQEKMENLKAKLKTANYDRARVTLARKVLGTIERYERALQNRKMEELENLTTEMYQRLARKSDFVGRVKINPETFEVTVQDSRGRTREKRSLSAGEKQIYAISLLWGLAQASNIELPIIIDTPFARLDSEHRTNIAKHYFPHASEQVIILSTDEEIDHRYVELLRPYIGRSYLIEHRDKERHSIVKDGYF
ncbi:MAG: DNA sulfur modification protein DndD [Acidobacteria bacterium]|nr:DNA sulfur modification protein DndD [Acidobacteriota bacterium]